MTDWLVEFAFRKRLVAALICILAAIYGGYCWTQLPITKVFCGLKDCLLKIGMLR